MAERKVYVFSDENGIKHIGSTGWRLFDNLKKFVFGEKKLWIFYREPTKFDEPEQMTECTHAFIQKLIKMYDLYSEVPLTFIVTDEPKPIDEYPTYVIVNQILVE